MENETANDNAGFEASPDTGDFGEGVGTLEEQILNSLHDEDEEGTDQETKEPAVESETKDSGQPEASSEAVPLFDINGKLSLKNGDKITADHLKELERGFLREADYTRKTQELAKVRAEANDILKAKEDIESDPRNLFNFIPPQKILSAFTKQEMLAHGLRAGGVSPQQWNNYITWFKKTGGRIEPLEDGEEETPPTNANVPPLADPYAEKMSDMARRLEFFEKKHLTIEQQQKADAEKRAADEQIAAYDKELDDALKTYPSVDRETVLVRMAAGNGEKSIKEIAKDINDAIEKRWNDYVATKTTQKKTTVKAPKGASVPVLMKRPRTFDDADAAIARVYGDGTLKG